MIEAVIIDFDDTLCLTEEACFNLENEVLRKMGRKPMNRKIHKDTWGQPLYEAITKRSPGINADEFWKVMPAIHEEFIGQGRIDVVKEDNLATLDKIIELGKKPMILTSRSEVECKHLIDPNHKLSNRIVAFYHKDHTKYHKPDPRVFEVIEKDHGLNGRSCVYLGDSPSDAEAAKGAGMHFIACMEAGVRTKDDFKDKDVDLFIDKFTELDTAIKNLESEPN